MTKILDIQQSIIAANGNASLAKELFTMLLNELDMRHQQIKSSFQSNDMAQLQEHIHKLYGGTAYCIVPKLRACTATLESDLKLKNYLQLKPRVDMVLQEIQQLLSDGPALLDKEWTDIKIQD